MATTQNTYTGNGSTVLYSFTFPYLETTDIKVSLNGTVTTAYTLANATTIQFTTAPANGVAIRIYRQTDDTDLQSTFYSGSAIRSSDLNNNFTQNLYVTQEANNASAAANTTASNAVTTANTAVTTANTALATANSATTTANTASTNASSAVTTANAASATATTASTNASSAVTTANTALATANSASTTATSASTTAASAVTTANTASTNATAAVSTANSAQSSATSAVSTANSAVTTANAANATAASAVTTANSAVSTATGAVTTANTANTKADQAIAAVSSSINYTLIANVAAIPSTPSNNTYIEVGDSTGIESFTPLTGRPAGFVGDSGLTVRLVYTTAGTTWNWLSYSPNNAETRYLKLAGGIVTGNLEIGTAGSLTFEGSTADGFETTLAVADPTADRTVTLPNVSGTVVTTGDTGTVTSTMLVDGTIVNADINASAAIAGTKISPNFGSQAVVTTGTSTAASFIPTSSTVPTNGIYLSGTNTVALASNSANRLTIDASGNVNIDSNTLYVDATNNRVGIGTTSPAQSLDVNGNVQISGSTPRLLANMSGTQSSRFAIQNSTTDGNTRFFLYPNGTGNISAINGINNSDPNASDYQAFDLAVIGTTDVRLSSSKSGSGSFLPITFYTSDNERARIDSSGRLLVGTSTARSNFFNTSSIAPAFQVEGTTYSTSSISLIANGNTATVNPAPYVILGRTRGTSVNSTTAVTSGDTLGAISFQGMDGTEFVEGAQILAEVDGTSGANDLPTRLVFSTTADGASSPTERMRIQADGKLIKYGDSASARIQPQTDNAGYLGESSKRWEAVYAVNGTIQTSDEREKTEIQDSPLGSDFVRSLRPVAYKWKIGGYTSTWDDEGNETITPNPGVRTHYGFIAQEVKQACGDADFGGWLQEDLRDAESKQSLRLHEFISPIVKALQEALDEIDTLKAKVAALESQ